MISQKKLIRQHFRDGVFARDNNCCAIPGCVVSTNLDAHHITDRNLIPNGGYVKENGISLCEQHHKDAEVFHSTGTALNGFSPADLYRLIGSSEFVAKEKSKKL